MATFLTPIKIQIEYIDKQSYGANINIMLNKPIIKYITITINDKNVEDFMRLASSGKFNTATNTIEIYSYKLDPNFSPAHPNNIKEMIKILADAKKYTINHEMRHWHNHKTLGDYGDFARHNYFQETSLYYLDEISAFSAGILYSDKTLLQFGTTPESIIAALQCGTDEFMHPETFGFYLSDITDHVTEYILDDLHNNNITLNKLKRQYHTSLTALDRLFSKRFHRAAKYLLTFDNQYVLNKKKLPPHAMDALQDVKSKLEQIKYLFLTKLQCRLHEIIY